MTPIDVRTVLIGYIVSNALCAVVMTSLWLQNRKRSPEIALWLVDYVLQLIALLLVTLRGVVPDLASIVLANGFIIGGTVVLYRGLERYVGKESRHLHNYVMVTVFTLVHAYLTFVYPSLVLRNLNLSLGLLYICAQGSWLMLRRVDPELRPATRATGVVFATLSLVSMAHVFANLVRPQVNDLFESGLFAAAVILTYQMLFIALTFALFLLVSRRLLTALEHELVERQRAEVLLATERQRLAYILEGTNVGTWEWNVQTGDAVFNERWAGIIGYTLAELAPVSIDTRLKFAHPDDLEVSRDLLEKHFRKELPYYECEARMRHKNGSWVWVLDRGKVATWTEDGKPLVMSGTHQDITARKQAEEEIHHLATHDVLTELPSLILAKDRLAMALSLGRRHKTTVAVMFIDMDDFKAVNDTLGHDAGDYVLKQVAQRLLSCARKTDTIARVGGDEFLLIATGLHSSDDAARIAEKVIRLVPQPVIFNGRQVVVRTSIGIALYPDHGEDMDQLIKQADEAMYRIKNAGKNGFSFANAAIMQ